MYLNKVTLIGYLARDADRRTARDGSSYVCFEVATKESWQDSKAEWQSRSEVHRCVAWGPQLVGSTAVLKKGAHIEVEGSLRSREFEKAGARHRVWEIRVTSISPVQRGPKAPESGPISTPYATPS